MAELERQKAELVAKRRAYKDKPRGSDAVSGEISQLDAMHAEIQRRRNEVRQRSRRPKNCTDGTFASLVPALLLPRLLVPPSDMEAL